MIVFEIIFWLCLAAVFHSYVLFPVILRILAAGKTTAWHAGESHHDFYISILISAFNEEEVIREKIESILNTDYPSDRFEILVGSDCSTDKTNQILSELEANPCRHGWRVGVALAHGIRGCLLDGHAGPG